MNELISENKSTTKKLICLPEAGRGLAWFVAIVGIYFLATIVYMAGFGFYVGVTQAGTEAAQIETLMLGHLGSLNGIAGMYSVQFFILIPILFLISGFKTQSFRQTLAFVPVQLKSLKFWLGIWLAYMVLGFFLDKFTTIPVDDFTRLMSGSKHLGIAIITVLLAPFLEEIIFRGYLFKVLRSTWLGFSGTLLITSMLFTLIHAGQYNVIILSQLFIFALILGIAREKTGSIYTPWLLHGLNNLVATIVVTYFGLI